MKKIILLSLSLILTIACFAGCGGNKQEQVTESQTIGQTQDIEGYTKLYDFESLDEVLSIKAFWDFGIMKPSDKHVTSGKSSMLLEVHGTQPDYHFVFHDWCAIDDQYLQFYAKDNEWIGLESNDFSAYENITVDFYNDSDRDVPVTLMLVTEADENNDGKVKDVSYSLGTKLLKKGQDTTAEWKTGFISRVNNINKLKYIKLIFPNREKEQAAAVIYADNMRAKIADKPKTYNKQLQEKEINFFEDDYDSYMWTNTFEACQYKSGMIFEADENFSTQGTRSMKVTLPKSPRSYFWDGTITAHMASLPLERVDLSKCDKDTTSIAVDFYLTSDKSVSVELFVKIDKAAQRQRVTLQKNKKVTVEIPLKKFSTLGRIYDL